MLSPDMAPSRRQNKMDVLEANQPSARFPDPEILMIPDNPTGCEMLVR